jgi:hypothetical protein
MDTSGADILQDMAEVVKVALGLEETHPDMSGEDDAPVVIMEEEDLPSSHSAMESPRRIQQQHATQSDTQSRGAAVSETVGLRVTRSQSGPRTFRFCGVDRWRKEG